MTRISDNPEHAEVTGKLPRGLTIRGESETVELKESFDREAVETAGAFANTKGGTIHVGVSRNGEPLGLEVDPETLSDWTNQISQSTDPRVIPDVELREVGGKKVVAIVVKEAPLKPVSVKGRCYRRVGTSNRVMIPAEISEMHLQSTGSSWDLYPAPGKTLQDVDPEKVNVGYALYCPTYYGLCGVGLVPLRSRALTGLVATACWRRRRNSSPREREVRRLNRNVNSSR